MQLCRLQPAGWCRILFDVGEVVEEGGAVLVLRGGGEIAAQTVTRNETDPDHIRLTWLEYSAAGALVESPTGLKVARQKGIARRAKMSRIFATRTVLPNMASLLSPPNACAAIWMI